MERFGEKISAVAYSGKEIAGLLKKMMMIDEEYKWKNHFYEMKGDVGMSLYEKERNKKMPTPRHKVTHNPIPTSLFRRSDNKHHYVSIFSRNKIICACASHCEGIARTLGVRFVERDFVEKHGCISSCLVSRCSVFDDTASEWYD